MTTQDTPPTEDQIQQTQQPPEQNAAGMESISPEQWQQFLGNMAATNQALQAQLAFTQNQLNGITAQQRKEQLDKLEPEQKAAALEAQLNAIQNYTTQAAQQQISIDTWKRRDAEAAARLLALHGLTTQTPGLYSGEWDQNWMPRFVASLERVVQTKATQNQQQQQPNDNPANRANVGTSTSSTIPELDPKADGLTTIRYALQRASEGR